MRYEHSSSMQLVDQSIGTQPGMQRWVWHKSENKAATCMEKILFEKLAREDDCLTTNYTAAHGTSL
jgi:hypothetical protein